MKLGIRILILFELLSPGSLELFTSMEHLKVLVETRDNTIRSLEKYLKKETQRTNIIEKYLNRYQTEHRLAMKDASHYVGNPMNALMLIKRLTHDLDLMEDRIKEPAAFRHTINATYPRREDLVGAIRALMRLQVTYQLNVTQLANGELRANFTADGVMHKDSFTPLTASDCYIIGQGYYNETEYKLSVSWLRMAYQKYQEEEEDAHDLDEVEIAKSIGSAYIMMNDLENIIIWMKKVIALSPKDPKSPRWRDLLIKYEDRYAQVQRMREEGWWRDTPWTVYDEYDNRASLKRRATMTFAQADLKMMQIYCGINDEFRIPPQVEKRLKCYYMTGPHWWLRLTGVRAEQLYARPDILLIRDLISDKEIEELKSIAIPRMKSIKPGKPHYHLSDAIISKSSWVYINESDVVTRIQKRVAMITGLEEGQEPIQVANYGISGHRLPHYDFLGGDGSPASLVKPDRIATTFFFMSNITLGGATVFPRLGMTIYPEKGSALLWYNLHPSGEGNIATQHAECPVLLGNKWVAVVFKSQVGQELRKPCTRERQELCDLLDHHYYLPDMAHETICVDKDRHKKPHQLMKENGMVPPTQI